VKEPDVASHTEPPRAFGLNQYILSLVREQPDAMKLLGVRFLYALGISAIPFFLAPLIATQIGLTGWDEIIAVFPSDFFASFAKIDPQGLAQIMTAVLLLAPGIVAIPLGFFGDKLGKKNIFALGLVACAGVGFFAASATTVPQMFGYLIAFGFGNAALTVLFFPFLADLVPASRVGEFAGLGEFVQVCGAFLSVAVVTALVRANLFALQSRLVFIFAAIFLLLAFVSIMFVRSKTESKG
jgi:MFS family permease